MAEEPLDLDYIHRFAAKLAIEAGSYLRDQALARASAQSYDLELSIKENAAVCSLRFEQ